MHHTCGKVWVDTGVAFLLAPFTTGHAFQVVVHHLFTSALRVGFSVAVASDCKSFHITYSFTCVSRPHQSENKMFKIRKYLTVSLRAALCMVSLHGRCASLVDTLSRKMQNYNYFFKISIFWEDKLLIFLIMLCFYYEFCAKVQWGCLKTWDRGRENLRFIDMILGCARHNWSELHSVLACTRIEVWNFSMRTGFVTYQGRGCFNGRKPSLLRESTNWDV